MRDIVLIILVVLALGTTTHGQCTSFVSDDGYSYDLNALANYQSTIQQRANSWTFYVSVCTNKIDCLSSTPASCSPGGYCQKLTSNPIQSNTYCVGTFSSIQGINGGNGVILTYREPNTGRVGTLTINCSPGGELVSNPIANDPKEITNYQFSFSSSAACGKFTGVPAKHTGLSGGSVFLIILAVCFAVFVVGGVVYNYAVVKVTPGAELFSHFRFVKLFFGYTQDGMTYTISKIKSTIG